MKKIVSLILLTATLCLSLASCDLSQLDLSALGNRDEGKEKTVTMYGVVVHLEEFNNTCVYFASGGHITMPRLESGEKVSGYEVGDLVKASFTTVGDGVAIMESFPGQIGIGADEIVIKKASVNVFSIEEDIYYVDEIPEDATLSIGECVSLSSLKSGENKALAEGEITDTEGGLYTIKLKSYGDLETLFMHRFEYGLSFEKK